MVEDPNETNDLSALEPETMADLLAAYAKYSAEVGVLEMPAGYNSLEQILANTMSRLQKRYAWLLGLIGIFAFGLIYALYRAVRHIFRRLAWGLSADAWSAQISLDLSQGEFPSFENGRDD